MAHPLRTLWVRSATPQINRRRHVMRTTQWFTSWVVLLVLCTPSMGQATAADLPEPYVALYGGVTVPQALQDTRGIGPTSAAKLTDLDLAGSGIYGIKLGLFQPDPLDWLAIETEFFYSSPHVKQQDITFTAPGVPTETPNFAGAHIRVAAWAVNWIIRYPGERLQPYAGVGPGIFWGRLSGIDFGTGSDTSLGLNALAGIRIFLTKQLAVFGEYKYNRTSFDFGGTTSLHVLYQAQHFAGGLSLHF